MTYPNFLAEASGAVGNWSQAVQSRGLVLGNPQLTFDVRQPGLPTCQYCHSFIIISNDPDVEKDLMTIEIALNN